MEKTLLRNVLKDLTPGQRIEVHFRGASEPEFVTVVGTKRGRGKHGSLLTTIEVGPESRLIEIGTPRNMEILSVTVDGNFFGVHSEREEPPVYPTDDARATVMKTSLNTLTGEAGRGKRLRLESSVPEYNGNFVVTQGRLEKGKYGQVHLWLTREETEETVELWSYRHSGIITNFEILGF
jgi:hypothetical protein